jgi:DNA-binding SARP family transcriptional activator
MIRCPTLGLIRVEIDGKPAPPELLWRKHLALLLYLARSPKGTRSREPCSDCCGRTSNIRSSRS